MQHWKHSAINMKKRILNEKSLPFFKNSLEIASGSQVTYTVENNIYTFSVVYTKEKERVVNLITGIGRTWYANIVINLCSEDMLN